MTQEEKFKVISNYFQKIINENVNVDVWCPSKNDYFGFNEPDDKDNVESLIVFKCLYGQVTVKSKTGGHLELTLTKEQRTEIQYLFNKIFDLAEEKMINLMTNL